MFLYLVWDHAMYACHPVHCSHETTECSDLLLAIFPLLSQVTPGPTNTQTHTLVFFFWSCSEFCCILHEGTFGDIWRFLLSQVRCAYCCPANGDSAVS